MDPNEALTRAREAYALYTGDGKDDGGAAWAAVDLAGAFHELDRSLSRGGFPPEQWRAGAGLCFSRDQVEEWAGRPLTRAELDRLAAALPHSSLPECVAEVARAVITVDPNADTFDSFGNNVTASELLDSHHRAINDSDGGNCTVCEYATGYLAGGSTQGHTTAATSEDVTAWINATRDQAGDQAGAGSPRRLADAFTPDEIDALIVTAADAVAGDPGDLSERQRELADAARALIDQAGEDDPGE